MSSVSSSISIHLKQGSVLQNYRIERILGEGGFGVTYLASDINLGRKVVIKENFPRLYATRDMTSGTVCPLTGNKDDDFYKTLSRFLDEARMLAHVSHPNIIEVLTVFEANATAYFVMPYIGEHSLASYGVRESGQRMKEKQFRFLLKTMLGALEYLHSQKIYHRDIKPANILISNKGTPILIDFGCAKNMDTAQTVTIMASLGFSAPEQMLGLNDELGAWTDLYALGATMYYLLTGIMPQRGDTRQFKDDLVPLASMEELKGEYSGIFLSAIDRAMAPDWKKRYRDAAEWLGDMSRAASGATTEVVRRMETTRELKDGEQASSEGWGGTAATLKNLVRNKTLLYLGVAVVLVACVAGYLLVGGDSGYGTLPGMEEGGRGVPLRREAFNLAPEAAEVICNTARLEGTGDKSVIRDWLVPHTLVTWNVNVPEESDYLVSVLTSGNDAGGNRWVVESALGKVEDAVSSSSGEGEVKETLLGGGTASIRLPKGASVLKMYTPAVEGGERMPVLLHGLRLTPVAFDTDSRQLVFGPDRKKTLLSIHSGGDWKITPSAPWVRVSPSSGRGDQTVSVFVEGEIDGMLREGELAVEEGTKEPVTRKVAVIQLGNEASSLFAGGYGTREEPFLIKTKEHLDHVRCMMKSWFRLENDLEFTKEDFVRGGPFFNGGSGWIPLGADFEAFVPPVSFTGGMDGNGKTIKGLASLPKKGGGAGLFGYLQGAEVNNLALEDACIHLANSSWADHDGMAGIGILAGMADSSVIRGVCARGIVSGKGKESCDSVGVLLGKSSGTLISDCYVLGTACMGKYVGGFVGNFNGWLRSGMATVNVLDGGTIGGLVGFSYAGTFQGCCLWKSRIVGKEEGNGNASSSDPRLVGAAMGRSICRLNNNFCSSDVEVSPVVPVSAEGALVWSGDSKPSSWEAAGFHQGKTSSAPWDVKNGRLMLYWQNPGQFAGSMVLTVEYDKVVGKADDERTLFAGGSGTREDPYLIEDKKHLDHIRKVRASHFRLEKDIVFTKEDFMPGGAFFNEGCGWIPIGQYDDPSKKPEDLAFTGSLDGNGKTIRGLASMPVRNFAVGLFGFAYKAEIKNLSLEDVIAYAPDTEFPSPVFPNGRPAYNVGALAGHCERTSIQNVSVKGYVGAFHIDQENIRSSVGLIAGFAGENCRIENCSVEGMACGGYYVGGVIGDLNSPTASVQHCCVKRIQVTSQVEAGFVTGSAYGGAGVRECVVLDGKIAPFYSSMDEIAMGKRISKSLVGSRISANITGNLVSPEARLMQNSFSSLKNQPEGFDGLAVSPLLSSQSTWEKAGFKFGTSDDAPWVFVNGEPELHFRQDTTNLKKPMNGTVSHPYVAHAALPSNVEEGYWMDVTSGENVAGFHFSGNGTWSFFYKGKPHDFYGLVSSERVEPGFWKLYDADNKDIGAFMRFINNDTLVFSDCRIFRRVSRKEWDNWLAGNSPFRPLSSDIAGYWMWNGQGNWMAIDENGRLSSSMADLGWADRVVKVAGNQMQFSDGKQKSGTLTLDAQTGLLCSYDSRLYDKVSLPEWKYRSAMMRSEFNPGIVGFWQHKATGNAFGIDADGSIAFYSGSKKEDWIPAVRLGNKTSRFYQLKNAGGGTVPNVGDMEKKDFGHIIFANHEFVRMMSDENGYLYPQTPEDEKMEMNGYAGCWIGKNSRDWLEIHRMGGCFRTKDGGTADNCFEMLYKLPDGSCGTAIAGYPGKYRKIYVLLSPSVLCHCPSGTIYYRVERSALQKRYNVPFLPQLSVVLDNSMNMIPSGYWRHENAKGNGFAVFPDGSFKYHLYGTARDYYDAEKIMVFKEGEWGFARKDGSKAGGGVFKYVDESNLDLQINGSMIRHLKCSPQEWKNWGLPEYFLNNETGASDAELMNENRIVLTAAKAVLGKGQKLESVDGNQKNVGFWTKEEAVLSWELKVVKAGNYKISINYSCADDAEGIPVIVSNTPCHSSLKWQVRGTGQWTDFKTVNLGTISIPEGKSVLKFKAETECPEGVANIREVILAPVP